MNHLDLFSGIGGFTLAAKRLGISTRQLCEICPHANQVLAHHFPDIPVHQDIKTYHANPGQFDIITAGFPCTGTSNAGSRTGLEHPESNLWFEALRIILECQPSFIIIEQPTGVIHRGLRAILGGLRLAGYASDVAIVSAASLGASHQRERLFIVAYPYCWQANGTIPPAWSDHLRADIETERANSSWLSIERSGSLSNHGLSTGLAGKPFTVPTRHPGRIQARVAAGSSCTPAQSAIAFRRLLLISNFYQSRLDIKLTTGLL